MALNIGTQLGSHEITALLGKVGMGEVYRARDLKLKREVAIKTLPEEFARDADRVSRFQREAQVLASLNHPNIAAIHDLQETNGTQYLVLELVEGETLADRIARGAIPVEEALAIAREISEGLGAAHEKGIIHRDLKPANVKVTPDGKVKVLDFGLAKAVESTSNNTALSNSPTLVNSLGATNAGMIIGTAAYMSPEQTKGKPVDRRADIWAFGVLLHEMLTGEQAFCGETVSDILASVLKEQPDFEKVPAKVRPLLRKCLEKEPMKRLQAIGDWELLLSGERFETPGELLPDAVSSRWIWPALAAALALALVFVSYRHVTEESPRVLKISVLPPEGGTFGRLNIPAVSPDGQHLALVATTGGIDRLWVRDLDSATPRMLAGTEGANLPFWSPDGRFIGFFANRRLKKIAAAGGPPVTLSDAADGRGGSWNQEGVIIFAPATNSNLWRVPADGSTAAVPLTGLEPSLSEQAHRFPWFLPDGRHFLFTIRSTIPDQTAVYVGDLNSSNDVKSRQRIVVSGSNAVYASPGYLLFLRERMLMAQPFDAGAIRIFGEAFPIAENVDYVPIDIRANFSVSQNGVLTYFSGIADEAQLTWFDRSGKVLGKLGKPGLLQWPAISPDGATVVVDRRNSQSGLPDLWLLDVARGTESRFTADSRSEFPVWSADGTSIVFRSLREGQGVVSRKSINAAGQVEEIKPGIANARPVDWSRDGRYLIEQTNEPTSRGDLWVVPLVGDGKPFPFLQTEFNEHHAKLSPNGRWLAYVSDETTQNEIYVQSFPTMGRKRQISRNGGRFPVWSRDGTQLFYFGDDQKMMAVQVTAGTSFEAGPPEALFDVRLSCCDIWFDVTKDGRFLIPTLVGDASSSSLTVVVNWQAGTKSKP